MDMSNRSMDKRPTLHNISSAVDLSVSSFMTSSKRKVSGAMSFRNSDLAGVMKIEPETTR